MKKLIAFLLSSLLAGALYAQEISIYADLGISGQKQKITAGNNSIVRPGVSLGVAYTHFFNKNWGLLSGIAFGLHNNKYTINNETALKTTETDSESSTFEYRIKTKDYVEKQQLTTLGIPLLLQYRTHRTKPDKKQKSAEDNTGASEERTAQKVQFYVNGGVKLLVPITSTAKVSAKEIVSSAYYPDKNLEIKDLPTHGFGTINNEKSTINYKTKLGLALSLGTGVSFKLAKMKLYTGVFADYGLNNLLKAKSGSLLSYAPSGLGNTKIAGALNTEEVKSAKILSYGIQLRLAFGK